MSSWHNIKCDGLVPRKILFPLLSEERTVIEESECLQHSYLSVWAERRPIKIGVKDHHWYVCLSTTKQTRNGRAWLQQRK